MAVFILTTKKFMVVICNIIRTTGVNVKTHLCCLREKENIMLNVNNVPKYAKSRRFWVIREVGEEYWFYGAFDDVTRAFKSAKEVENALLIENTELI